MKKRRSVAIIFIIVAAAFLLLAGPFRFTIQKQVVIHASLYDISKRFTDLGNWPSWYPLLKKVPASEVLFSNNTTTVNSTITWNDKHSILIIAVNPAAIIIKETNNGKAIYQSLEGFPTDYGNSTILSWSKKVNGWKWVQEKLFASDEISTGLNELKKICEDPAKEYGFDISIERVYDTVIATKKINTSKKEKLTGQHLLYKDLLSFLKAQHISIPKKYIYTSTISTGQQDSVAIAVGIPVAAKGINSNEIKFLELPARGRLLIGSYTGPYGQINNIYEAMDRYIKNKGMKIVAQPMEEHTRFDALTGDSMQVTVRLIYPVY